MYLRFWHAQVNLIAGILSYIPGFGGHPANTTVSDTDQGTACN